jgi:hypothetical protein
MRERARQTSRSLFPSPAREKQTKTNEVIVTRSFYPLNILKKRQLEETLSSSHPSAFFGAAAAYLCTSFAMVNIVPFAFLRTCIADVSAQIAKLLCKLAVHRHQRCRCPADSSALAVNLSAASHHLDIPFFQIGCGTKFTCFGAAHAGVYAALPFRVLKSCGRRHNNLSLSISNYRIYGEGKVVVGLGA